LERHGGTEQKKKGLLGLRDTSKGSVSGPASKKKGGQSVWTGLRGPKGATPRKGQRQEDTTREGEIGNRGKSSS